MKFFKKRSLLLILLINISFAQEDTAEYKIELIIFKFTDIQTNETFKTNLKYLIKTLFIYLMKPLYLVKQNIVTFQICLNFIKTYLIILIA